ncbi:Uncharacterised protein [uncultured Clostridium sp.]|uniref:hypothetical protein n=1 Tax=uncultured Clostridium sp. TaxID=59620 RepID=UPI0008215559|nr:hypothetical protein [uncultured Clostridium sp.]SCK04687.1 Uncharacterised protein [uncultured Clostridium sp.]
MIKEIDINLTTITNLLSKIIEDKKLYIKAKNIDFQFLNNKYILMSSLIRELSVENFICIHYMADEKLSKKKIKQLYILLQDIKYKFNKAKAIIDNQTIGERYPLTLTEITDVLLLSNVECNYLTRNYENLKNNIYEIKDYFWINNFVNKIKGSNIINSYLKYKKLNNSDRFKYMQDDISYEDIDRVYYKLNCLLNNKYALIPPIFINDFTDYFINSNFSLDINDSELLKSVLDIKIDNIEAVKVKWYQYFDRKKLKLVKEYNEKILTKQKTMRNIIFSQYKENIESLKMYVKSFEFLKSVINESYFNRIYDYMYDENEMYIYLKKLSTNIYLFKELIKIRNEMKTLSDKERELLDFCFDKYDTISIYKSKLYSIPTMIIKNHFKIYKENHKKSNITKDELDNLIVNLNHDITLLKSFLYSLDNLIIVDDITEIDDKNTKEVYSINKFEYDDCISYIDESLNNKIANQEIEGNDYEIVKLIKETITNLGYKIVQNYKLGLINLELAVVNPKDINEIVYIFIDCFQVNTYYSIRKLSYIKEKNIPIIYCWSDDFIINRNVEVFKLKTQLETLLR